MDLLSSKPSNNHKENSLTKPSPLVLDVAIASVLILTFFLYLFVLSPSWSVDNSSWLTSYNPFSHRKMTFKMTVYQDELDEVLAEASDGNNKTVIITVVNKAYAEGDKPMLDLFLDGFWLGNDTQNLINYLLVVAVDKTSYERCRFLRLRCYKLETDGVDFEGEEVYMSEDFIKMMWRRTVFLGDVLRRGYNFVFTDTDIVWLRNPFPQLMASRDGEPDVQISTDRFNGDEWSKEEDVNTGFFMVRSNNKTVALLEAWYEKRNINRGMKEQDVLQDMIRNGPILHDLGLKVRFLDTVYFSGFCQDSRDVKNVITVHANCCRTISAKLKDLTAVIHRWKEFKSSRGLDFFAWSVPHSACADSWKG